MTTLTTEQAAEDAMRRHLAELMAIQQLSIPDGSQSGEATNQGSVLAVVRFPDTQGRDCNGVGKFGKLYQLRLDYDRLIELESGKIRDMLKPKSQERFRRLLKMDSLPPGIDYVLDFTPTEDEGAAELMISLWLPDSTKIWWMAGHYKPQQLLTSPTSADGRINTRPLADRPIGAVLVLGHDDECSCYTTYSDISDIWAKKEDVPCICHGIWEPLYRRKEKIKDFCRIRARMNVVRILRAIAGEDLLVNSATRMWTLANLADLLEVVPIVRDTITQWFLATPNTKFIEMFPEESFKVALMLQIRDVLLASFKILVSERAVDHAATTPLPKPPAMTWMQRKHTIYEEDMPDAIEHASRAFAERMKRKLDALLSDSVFDDTLVLSEWTKLQYYAKRIAALPPSPFLTSVLEDLNKLKEALISNFRSFVKKCMYLDPLGLLDNLIAAQRAHYCPLDKQTPLTDLIKPLNEHQRACLPFFWHRLKDSFPALNTWKFSTYKHEYLSVIASTLNEDIQRALDRSLLTVPYDDFRTILGGSYDFSESTFHTSLELELASLSLRTTGSLDLEANGIQFLLSDHLLLTLDESETKYLPLWAGGNDDGSGGVFQDEVPPTDMGPNQPGPHFHTGHTIASSSGGGGATDASSTLDGYARTEMGSISDLGVGELGLDDFTTARSMAAQATQDSDTSTIGGRSGVVSLASEAFTSGDDESMREAMMAAPAAHQWPAQEAEQSVQALSEGGGGGGSRVVVQNIEMVWAGDDDFDLEDDEGYDDQDGNEDQEGDDDDDAMDT